MFTPHGNALQSRVIDRLREAFRPRPQQFGAFRVSGPYLHSKVIVVDDVLAVIGLRQHCESFDVALTLPIAADLI